jgi:hypothetical protein
MSSDLDAVRRSTLATIDDIKRGEREFKEQHGIDIIDEFEWMELRDIIARIERKLAGKIGEAA